MISLSKILAERKQVGKLYHFTYIFAIDEILESGLLYQNDEGSISMTRRPNMHTSFLDLYHLGGDGVDIAKFDNIGDSKVRMTFDGDRISDHYKIIPRSYMEDNGYVEDAGEEEVIPKKGRWKGNFPIFPYLERIDIFVPKDTDLNNLDSEDQEAIDNAINAIQGKNIPYKIYKDLPEKNLPIRQR